MCEMKHVVLNSRACVCACVRVCVRVFASWTFSFTMRGEGGGAPDRGGYPPLCGLPPLAHVLLTQGEYYIPICNFRFSIP